MNERSILFGMRKRGGERERKKGRERDRDRAYEGERKKMAKDASVAHVDLRDSI